MKWNDLDLFDRKQLEKWIEENKPTYLDRNIVCDLINFNHKDLAEKIKNTKPPSDFLKETE